MNTTKAIAVKASEPQQPTRELIEQLAVEIRRTTDQRLQSIDLSIFNDATVFTVSFYDVEQEGMLMFDDYDHDIGLLHLTEEVGSCIMDAFYPQMSCGCMNVIH